MKAGEAVFNLILIASICNVSCKGNGPNDNSGQKIKGPTPAKYRESNQTNSMSNNHGYTLPLDIGDIVNFREVGRIIDVNSVAYLIRENGFAILEPGVYSDLSLEDIDSLYVSLSEYKIPAFITAEAGLYLYHTLLEEAIKGIEDAAFPEVSIHIGDPNKLPFTGGEEGNRAGARGLELMALLGSRAAVNILTGEGDVDRERREQDSALNQVDWHENLYWSWLYSLRALLQEFPEGHPEFMRAQAWQRRQLHAALASWTQYGHRPIRDRDPAEPTFPIPYRLPPAPRPPLGYVEPIPVFWGRLLSLTRMASRRLDSLGVLTPESRDQLSRLEELLRRISNIADRQLANEPPSSEDAEFFEILPTMLRKMLPGAEKHGLATILAAEAAEVDQAVGDIDLIIVACPTHDGKVRPAVGPVLSYYEFKHPKSTRLTDETWRLMLDSPARPGRPRWYAPLVRLRKDFSGLTRLTHNLTPDGTPCWSPDGRRIAFAGSEKEWKSDIYVMYANGTGKRNLTNNPSPYSSPCWSPDGKKIAFVSGQCEICVMNADGSEVKRLTDNPALDMQPSWSPDGKRIVFWSDRTGRGDICVMNADGSEQTRLTNNSAFDRNPCWSPDGKQIAFESDGHGRGFNCEIYVMNSDGSEEKRLTDNSAHDKYPCWSPDGRQIAFESNRDGNFEIYVMNTDGSRQKRLTNSDGDDGSPCWSPDGKKIAFHSFIGISGYPEICVMNLE